MDPNYSETVSIEQDHPSLTVEEEILDELARHVVTSENATLVHLSIVLTDHTTVRRLNKGYLDHDYNTDVLSFSLRDAEVGGDPDAVEGEVYVDLDTAAERHDEFDASFEWEACRYVVHGVLHLLGYDDATEAGKQAMRAREDTYLGDVLSPDPST